MSHFSVLVIGDDVEGQLQPYHEFECTGEADQYVQNVEVTQEARQAFAAYQVTRLRSPDGALHEPYADPFYREPTPEEIKEIGPIAGTGVGRGMSWTSKDWGDGRGYRTKIRFVPDGWDEVTVPASEVETFAEWVQGYYGLEVLESDGAPDLAETHKYGWVRVAAGGDVVEVVDRTNPNKRWDWWVVGGRFRGFFRMKVDALVGGAEHSVGVPGLFDREPAQLGTADSARKGDIDLEAMRDEAGEEAGARWERAHRIIAGREVRTWAEVRESSPDDLETARKVYREQPAVRDLSEDSELGWFVLGGLENLLVPRDEYVQRARDGACCTFAVVKDGQWHQRGEMGWWGVVSQEKDRTDWEREFAALVDGLPDDTLLTVVDCHI